MAGPYDPYDLGRFTSSETETWRKSVSSYDPKIAAERQSRNNAIKNQIAVTLSLAQAFPEVMPKHTFTGTDPERLAEVIYRSRWLCDQFEVHQLWQSHVERLVRRWDQKLQEQFHAYLASFAWADQVEGAAPELREKAIKLRELSELDKAKKDTEQLALMRQQAAEKQALEQAKAAEVEQLRIKREAELLEREIDDLVLEQQRDAIGGGTW